jgi:chromosome segregation ATPase
MKDPAYTAQRDAAASAHRNSLDARPSQAAKSFKLGSDHEHERARAEIASLEHSYRDLAKEIDRLTERARLSHETAKINHEEVMRLTAELENERLDRQGKESDLKVLTAENAELKQRIQHYHDTENQVIRELRAKLSLETAEIKRLCGLLTDAKSRLEKAEAHNIEHNQWRVKATENYNRINGLRNEANDERDAARAMAERLAGALDEMYESSCRNANSTPSKAAFIKAREGLAEWAAYEAGER